MSLPKVGLVFFLLVTVLPTPCLRSQPPLTFGVVPQQCARKLARNWGPVCLYLGRHSGIDIRFATAPDIPEFERRLANGLYDVAYMNPYHYTVFCRKPGYLALAKQKDKQIAGILVVAKTAPDIDLHGLAGKTLVFPSPAAFAASILTRTHLQKARIPIVARYVKSHDSVYRNVAQGFYTAGGGVVRTLMNTDPATRDQLRILWKSESFSPHAIAVHPRVQDRLRQILLKALIRMNHDPEAGPLLEAIEFKGFAPASDDQWDDVRELNIDLLAPLVDPAP